MLPTFSMLHRTTNNSVVCCCSPQYDFSHSHLVMELMDVVGGLQGPKFH